MQSNRHALALAVMLMPALLWAQNLPTPASRQPSVCTSPRAGDTAPTQMPRVPNIEGLGAFVQCWYTEQLAAMGEPALFAHGAAGSDTIVRFTWLRTFHPGIAVRVTREAAGVSIAAVELDGAGGYAPGTVARRTNRILSSAEWQGVLRAASAADVWRAPSRDSISGLDGAEWVVETRTSRGYHLVARWSPTGGPYRELGLALLRLGGVLPSRDVY